MIVSPGQERLYRKRVVFVHTARESPTYYYHRLPVRNEDLVFQPEVQLQPIAPLRPRLKLETAQAFIFADHVRGIVLG
jgi:hypothetical protein